MCLLNVLLTAEMDGTGNCVSNFSALEIVSRRQAKANKVSTGSRPIKEETGADKEEGEGDEVLWYNGGTIPMEHKLAPPALIPPFHYSNHRLLWLNNIYYVCFG